MLPWELIKLLWSVLPVGVSLYSAKSPLMGFSAINAALSLMHSPVRWLGGGVPTITPGLLGTGNGNGVGFAVTGGGVLGLGNVPLGNGVGGGPVEVGWGCGLGFGGTVH